MTDDPGLPLPDTRPRRRAAVVAAALFLAVAGLYARTVTFEFVNYDDPGYVYANPHVRAGLTVETFVWAFTTGEQGNWHPLTWLSHALDWELYKEWAGGHHVTSVLVHALTTALTFAWLFRATRAIWPSAIAAAAFGLHPLHMESVAWVAERKDVLCAFFFVLGLCCYTEYRCKPTVPRYAAVTACLVLALLSKPMAVTFPFVLLLVDVWPLAGGNWRARVAEKVPWLALALLHSAVTYLVQDSGGNVVALQAMAPSTRLANAAASYAAYAIKTVFPVGIAAHYPYPAGGPPPWQWAGGAVFVVVGSAAALYCVRRAPFVFVGWFWYAGMLVPVIGLVQVGRQAYADRYIYLPQIGLVVAVVWTVYRLTAGHPGRRRAAGAIAAAAVAAYAAVTWQGLPAWQNSIALFTRALDVTTDNATAHVQLGVAYANAGDYEKALEHCLEAQRISPNEHSVLVNLGLVQTKLKRWNEAEQSWRAALRVLPTDAAAYGYLGEAIEAQGRPVEAEQAYAESVRLDPKYVWAHEKRGRVLLSMGKFDEAITAFRSAATVNGAYATLWSGLGASLSSAGQYTESFSAYRRALELDPANADIRLSYARALALSSDSRGALKQLDILLRRAPNHTDAIALRKELNRGQQQ